MNKEVVALVLGALAGVLLTLLFLDSVQACFNIAHWDLRRSAYVAVRECFSIADLIFSGGR